MSAPQTATPTRTKAPPIKTTARASIGLPAPRVEQIRSLAEARQMSATALIEEWINRAIAEGAPGAIELPDYSAHHIDDVVGVKLAGRLLPMMDRQKAILLATVLDGAAGIANPVHEFNLGVGRAVPIDLESATLTVGRLGHGVVFKLESKMAEKTVERFAAPSSFVTDLARMIRKAIATP